MGGTWRRDIPRVDDRRGNFLHVKTMIPKILAVLVFLLVAPPVYSQRWERVVESYNSEKFGARRGVVSRTFVTNVSLEPYQGSDQCHITFFDKNGHKTHTPTVPNRPVRTQFGYEYTYRNGAVTASMLLSYRKGILIGACYMEQDRRIDGVDKTVFSVTFKRL
jgi:hypothetical protein